ncbi:MAG: NAD(P) transhydrogenase subunit alpha [Candidatus Hydrogenedentales bacterium]|jgi:NAD(P) transhydrogenase subunit alpha
MTSLKGLTIGVPREIISGERRVAVTPETTARYVAAGAQVLIEAGAGLGAFFDDDSYRAAGAEILADVKNVYARSTLVLKVKEPQFNPDLGVHEGELIPEKTVLVCFLHPANPLNHDTVRLLAARNITSFSLDSIPRVSRAQHMDALTSMSTVAGYKAVITAAHHLARFVPMIPTDAGIIEPARVLVVGTGVAGLQSIATAKRLGARVSTLDIRPEANEQARSLGALLVPFALEEGEGVGEGGYAKRLSEDLYERERTSLTPVVAQSDIIILTALVPRERAPILITKAMVEGMKKGAVIVDVAIDQGGNCELTRPGESYVHKDVLLVGLLNIPASLAIDSTRMFAHNLYEYIGHIAVDGNIDEHAADDLIQDACVTRDGRIVHQGTLRAMGLAGD